MDDFLYNLDTFLGAKIMRKSMQKSFGDSIFFLIHLLPNSLASFSVEKITLVNDVNLSLGLWIIKNIFKRVGR